VPRSSAWHLLMKFEMLYHLPLSHDVLSLASRLHKMSLYVQIPYVDRRFCSTPPSPLLSCSFLSRYIDAAQLYPVVICSRKPRPFASLHWKCCVWWRYVSLFNAMLYHAADREYRSSY